MGEEGGEGGIAPVFLGRIVHRYRVRRSAEKTRATVATARGKW
jgi:hypothetical protein